MKKNKPIFEWDNGIATCSIQTKYGEFKGIAQCHPDDEDMMSEKVGCEIAYSRAIIKTLHYEKECIIKPSLKALKQLKYSMKHSNKFNPKSYENRMLNRQIQNWEFDLNVVNDMITTERKYLKEYIDIKENLYKIIRTNKKV